MSLFEMERIEMERRQCDLLTNIGKDDLESLLSLASAQHKLDIDVLLNKFLNFEINITSIKGFYMDNELFRILLMYKLQENIAAEALAEIDRDIIRKLIWSKE